jgi:1-acyl-sn-glycerol-3-phosphate acyltransferase
MSEPFYHLFRSLAGLFLWRGELIGKENLPAQGPAVLVANHANSAGPIAAICSLPMRIHPWVIAYMVDKELAPGWVQADFCERQLHLKPPLGRWLARAMCAFIVPLFQFAGCIPVAAGDYRRMEETLRMSLEVLRKGGFVMVFPEDYRLAHHRVTDMQPFQHSFVRLAEAYYQETGQRLAFIPMAAHNARTLMIGEAVYHDPFKPVGTERRRLKNMLEQSITRMYMELEAKGQGRESAELASAER